MTDPGMADATYIEPISARDRRTHHRPERPDALLPTMGGQTALNTAMALAESGVLAKYNVEMIGAKRDVIAKAEDRLLFREAMDRIGLSSPRSKAVKTLGEAREAMPFVGLPAIIRPSFTLAGTGGGIAYNGEEFERIVAGGLAASPMHEVLVEESVLGWKEFEMEVVRDSADNCIIVCSIENVDPMGVHTGDSITVAPALTLTDKEFQIMRDASIAVLREVGVDTGGSNVQFAVNPERRAHGRDRDEPARVALVGAGVEGDRLSHRQGRREAGGGLHARRTAQRHHRRDARVVRADHRLRGHQDPALHLREVPGRRSHAHHVDEVGGRGHEHRPHLPESRCRRDCARWRPASPASTKSRSPGPTRGATRARSGRRCSQPRADRLLMIAQAFRYGLTVEEVRAACAYDRWFLDQIKGLVAAEEIVRAHGLPKDAPGLLRLKKMGFSDERLAKLTGRPLDEVDGAARVRWAWPRSSSASTPAPPSSPRARPICIRATRATVSIPPNAKPTPAIATRW